MKRGVLKMDSLDIFFSVINHPIKITILKFMEENEHRDISFTDLMEFFLIDHLSIERVVLITNIWEMYNDHLLRKRNSPIGTLFELTESAKELNKIITDFDYWSKSHQFYGGI